MYELLQKKLSEIITLTEEEFEVVKTFFQPKKLRKKRFLLQEGDICHYTAFVEKGLMRTYSIDEKGAEHILQFSLEGWWTADLYSFLTQEPSIYNIEAIEECELLIISQSSWEEMFLEIPKMEHYFRVLLQNNLINTQRRLMGAFKETAEEKYLKLFKTFPDLFQRVPQHMIASYLGVTRETLSRVRSAQMNKE
ncbi:MAG TPA: Crp/Fnr family transcriptional regulator [Edaphocola sp.]|nr:Crp/Fnr family transcriptional regulator [Edaphocola sp.]